MTARAADRRRPQVQKKCVHPHEVGAPAMALVIASSSRRCNRPPMTLTIAAAAFCGFACLFHFASIIAAAHRCKARAGFAPPPANAPAVTIIRPVCGLENHIAETLESSFRLDYPDYEVIFCVASGKDPIVPVVEALLRRHPHVRARLLVGDERISANPKLNNCVKGWKAAAHDWIVIADSNVLMPRDYVQRLFEPWRDKTGLVCAPPIGGRPVGFWAELECAFLNTYQARAQYFADTIGLGFAQGKTMFWRRAVLDRAGGIRALAADLAEDAASTKVVRAAGRKVQLVDRPFVQPLGHRRALEVWRRQSRWARLRRACFPHYFLPEIASGGVFPMVAAGLLASAMDWPAAPAVFAFGLVWYGGEIALARAARWHLSALYPVQALLRDLLLPVLWLDGLFGSDFEWRGNAMSVAVDSEAVEAVDSGAA
jgi:ceramide glucosyltransferase